MKLSLVPLLAVVMTFGASPTQVCGATLVFDENAIPTNPVNGFGSFTFGEFSNAGVITDGPTSILIDSSDFGGVGVDYVVDDGNGTFVAQNFNADTHKWEMSVRVLPDNVAPVVNVSFVDDDGAGTADEFQYNFDLTGVPADGQFHTLTVPMTTFGFNQAANGFTIGNEIVDPGARQIQIQSAFGSTDRLNIEVDYVQIVPIPEPGSMVLLGLGFVAICVSTGRSCRSS